MTPLEAYGLYLLVGAIGAVVLWIRGDFQLIDVGSVLFVALCVSLWPFVLAIHLSATRR